MLPKQLFYVTQDQLCAYQWRRGRLGEATRFGADAAAIEAFGDYLDAHPGIPASLVADLVEEDFQRQLLPHVGGRSGRELLARRLGQLYRETPWRHAVVQGRETEGRRDDQVLFSALTNGAILQPWVQALEQHRTPLAAIHSAAHLSALLARKISTPQEHLLLITRQSGGLRQSYFQGRDLKFSRLTELAEDEPLAAHSAAETARMQQFLTSTRMLVRGDLLRVMVLTPAADLAALEALCEDRSGIAFHFIEMDSAAARLKLDSVPQLCDRLLLTLVARQTPPTQYALGPQGRFYQLWQTRMTLFGASAALALGASLWVAAAIWSAAADSRDSARLLAEAASYDSRYHATMASLPPSATRTANMKAAVQLESLLRAQAPAPSGLIALVSRALERTPAITLNALEWKLAQPGAAMPAATGEASNPVNASSLGIGRPPLQQLLVEGEVGTPQTSYRAILAALGQFVLDLRGNPNLTVEVAETPLDVRSDVKLSGKAGVSDTGSKPKFVLKLSWRP